MAQLSIKSRGVDEVSLLTGDEALTFSIDCDGEIKITTGSSTLSISSAWYVAVEDKQKFLSALQTMIGSE